MVSFCVSDNLFQLTEREEPFEQSIYFTDLFLQSILLIHTLCFGILTLYIKCLHFHSIAWDYFEYHTPISYTSFPWIYRNKLPRTDISVKMDGAPK